MELAGRRSRAVAAQRAAIDTGGWRADPASDGARRRFFRSVRAVGRWREPGLAAYSAPEPAGSRLRARAWAAARRASRRVVERSPRGAAPPARCSVRAGVFAGCARGQTAAAAVEVVARWCLAGRMTVAVPRRPDAGHAERTRGAGLAAVSSRPSA